MMPPFKGSVSKVATAGGRADGFASRRPTGSLA